MAVRNDTKRVEEVEEGVLCTTILGYHAHNIKKYAPFLPCMVWTLYHEYNHFQFMWRTKYSDYQMSRKALKHPKRNKPCPLPTM